jgi:uncharacterized protein (TIGR02231 family)
MSDTSPSPATTRVRVETQISEVTVYTNRALVTRRGTLTLTGEEQELIVEGLPPTLEAESVRTSAVGTVAVRLLGVRTERTFTSEAQPEHEAELARQVQELGAQYQAVYNRLQALQMQQTFVKELSSKAVERFSQSLARQQTSLEDTAQLLEFLGQRYTDYAASIAEQEKERLRLDRELKAKQRQLEEIRIPESKEVNNLIVDVAPAGAGELQLEISYVVNRASWKPLYDLRVSLADKNINLTYLAEVTQNSGEDWEGVRLTLSTAKPGLGTLPPKPDPWYIDGQNLAAMRARTFQRRSGRVASGSGSPEGAAFGSLADTPAQFFNDTDIQPFSLELGGNAPEPQPQIEATNVAAEVANEGGVVTFRVDRDSDIPGDNNPHKITVFSDNFPCRIEYVALPRLVSFAYLQATMTNPANGATLLPGKANIFRDNIFVGTTQLENIAPGQEFKLNLGIDEGLKIERDLVEREVDKRLISGNRRVTYGYRLTVTNLREQEAVLKLTEQIPVSRTEQIKVKLNRISPQIQPGELGALEWSLTLPPKAKREFSYQFTIEHPAELNVSGLNV